MRANQAEHAVSTMCRVLGVSPSGYYTWRGRGRSSRAKRDEGLRSTIESIHQESRGTYGVPRVHAELAAGGCRVSRKRVARLMREAGLVGVSRRRGTRTTRVDRAAPDRVERQFHADAPDRHYLRTDLGGVRVSGHRARCVQPPGGGMGDGHPSAYRAGARGAEHGHRTAPPRRGRSSFRQRYPIHLARLRQAMPGDEGGDATGSAGDCFDNAMAESFFATLECELIGRRAFGWPARPGTTENAEAPRGVRTGRGEGRIGDHQSSRPLSDCADRRSGGPQPPSGAVLPIGLGKDFTTTGDRSPQCW